MEVGGKIIVAVVHQILASRLIIVITPLFVTGEGKDFLIFNNNKKEIVLGKLISPPTLPLCFSKNRNLGPEKREKEDHHLFIPRRQREAGRTTGQ